MFFEFIDADFDEARFDAGAFDSALPFGDPARGELAGGFGVGVARKEFVGGTAIIIGVGEDMKAGLFCQAAEHARVTADVGWSAIDKSGDAAGFNLGEERAHSFDNSIDFPAGWLGLTSPYEIAHDVLVGKSEAEFGFGNGAEDRLDGRKLVL